MWYGTSGRFTRNISIVNSMKKQEDVKVQELPPKFTFTFPNVEAATIDNLARQPNLIKICKYLLINFLCHAFYMCTVYYYTFFNDISTYIIGEYNNYCSLT
jgi:hypothetical protein